MTKSNGLADSIDKSCFVAPERNSKNFFFSFLFFFYCFEISVLFLLTWNHNEKSIDKIITTKEKRRKTTTITLKIAFHMKKPTTRCMDNAYKTDIFLDSGKAHKKPRQFNEIKIDINMTDGMCAMVPYAYRINRCRKNPNGKFIQFFFFLSFILLLWLCVHRLARAARDRLNAKAETHEFVCPRVCVCERWNIIEMQSILPSLAIGQEWNDDVFFFFFS